MKFVKKKLNWIELLILVASFCILAAVIIKPMYETHLLKEKFAEVVKATEHYKLAIEICAKFGECATYGKLAGMQEGTLGIPDTISTAYIDRISVADNGTITTKTTRAEGLTGETYVLTPHYVKDVKGVTINWTVSGSCKTRPAGAIC